MANTPWQNGFLSTLGLGVQTGFVDILCLVEDGVLEAVMDGGNYTESPSIYSILQVSSFEFENNQPGDYKTRLVGEGAETSTFHVAPTALKVNIKMPLLVTSMNWIEQSISELWTLAKFAHWGTPTIIRSLLIDSSGAPTSYASGTTSVYVSNVSDFMDIPLPFTATLSPGTATEEDVSVTAVNKSYRKLTFASGTVHTQPPNATLSAMLSLSGGPDFEPAFGLLSLREGFLAPCLVNRITITAKVGEVVNIDCNIVCGGIWRSNQVDILSSFNTLTAQRATQIFRTVEGIAVTTSSGTETVPTGQFGLAFPTDDRLFSGFEGLDLPSLGITSSTITIDNAIREVYTPHSTLSSFKDRQRDQSYPYALVSDGRKISGRIDYITPIDPWQVAERLTASSKVNGGGVTLDYGCCKVVIPDVVWKASSSHAEASSEAQTRYVEWFMVSDDYNSMPYLEYSSTGYGE